MSQRQLFNLKKHLSTQFLFQYNRVWLSTFSCSITTAIICFPQNNNFMDLNHAKTGECIRDFSFWSWYISLKVFANAHLGIILNCNWQLLKKCYLSHDNIHTAVIPSQNEFNFSLWYSNSLICFIKVHNYIDIWPPVYFWIFQLSYNVLCPAKFSFHVMNN